MPPTSVQDAFDEQKEVYDSSLQFSPPKPRAEGDQTNGHSECQSPKFSETETLPTGGEEDWAFISANNQYINYALKTPSRLCHSTDLRPDTRQKVVPAQASFTLAGCNMSNVSETSSKTQLTAIPSWSVIDDSHEYEPLEPFVRPPFPSLIVDRCPVSGLSGQTFLRTCFRIGEMFQAGSSCSAQKLNPVIELFARVNFSSREPGTTKQHFQFMDLWVSGFKSLVIWERSFNFYIF